MQSGVDGQVAGLRARVVRVSRVPVVVVNQLVVLFACATVPALAAENELSPIVGDWEQCAADSDAWLLIRIQPYEYGLEHVFGADGALQSTQRFRWTSQVEGYAFTAIKPASPSGDPEPRQARLLQQGEQALLYLQGNEQPFKRAADRCFK